MLPKPLPYAPIILKLLKGVIYSDDPDWEHLQSCLTPIQEYLGKIGLVVRNYETDGFAYLEQPDCELDEQSKPLPRLTARHPLSFKVTILCVLLREELRKFDASDKTGRLILDIEKIRELLKFYLPFGNNEEKFNQEVDKLVNSVKDLGFVRQLPRQDKSYEILPIIKAKIDADTLALLKQKLEAYTTLSSD